MSFGIPVRNGLAIGLLSSTTLSSNGGLFPAMALNFLIPSLDSRVTFTRGTTGTFIGSNGLIQTAAINGPRFDYDPVTLAPRGLLIEEQRVNVLTYSEQFDNAAWTKVDTTVSANATVSPDGTTNADKIVETATTGAHWAFQSVTTTAVAHTATAFMKASERTWGLMRLRDSTGNDRFAWFNLATGAVGTVQLNLTASITSFGNGWYRCSISISAALAGSNPCVIGPATADNVSSYAGTAGSGIFIWGAQLEAASFATSYIPTVASQVTRSADVASMTGTNFSSWYNASAGTLFVSATGYNAPTVSQGSTAPTAASLYAAAAGNSFAAIAIYRRDGAVLNSPTAVVISDAGFVGADIPQSSISWAGATVKAAFAWNGTTDAAFTANGATVGTDSSYTLPTSDSLQIGRWGSEGVTGYWSGHILSIAYYNTRLPNATLVSLTT
jgi:hypothetical protein